MAMPIIGVTPSQDDATGRITINQDYLDAIHRAGGMPLLLPLFDNRNALEAALSAIDGLVLTGGADVGPQCYGEERLPVCGAPAPLRDKMEFSLCALALERDMPILAICRGHQVLNCTLGGALYQDIETQFSPQLKHPCYSVPRDQVHGVRVDPSSRLAAILGMTDIRVNSRHHQAVKRLGKGVKAVAWAEDGLVEAVELPGKAFVASIQWHPESLSDYRPEAQALFNALVAAAGRTA